MSTATLVIGPEHHGQKMSLEDFENAQGREGYLYELSRGVITVTDIPNPRHFRQVKAVENQLHAYDYEHPGRIDSIATGSECKIPVEGLVSERHPDLTVYLTPMPPGIEGSEIWAFWIPEMVIEIVSPKSADRDYNEKPEEYLQFGVKEYWIVDAEKERMTVLVRSRGVWKTQVVRPPATHASPLLPGLQFDLQPVFAAAADSG